ncbi:hypothetical protein [Sulfitobacter sp. R18_1]|uniref:hypothetical protein n=1 Tax=Sulfitobacter sp. R18_1 TaxID=2821104 RepID=UPI001ADD4063|nr:hypothetical protein [Sulfitobacter sp. R18_1]MBO9428852.1 hypothetical protein [Sulfitobacter sp. R18_1]
MKSKHYVFLFLVTGVYLLFELAFNARLLDVVGSTLDHDAVDEIEFFGRIISGIAFTLVLWPMVLKYAARDDREKQVYTLETEREISAPTRIELPSKAPKKPYGLVRTGFLLAITLALGVATSYGIQEGILKGITATSSAAQKRAAATLVALTGAMHSENVSLDGLPMDQVDLDSPEGKTFLAILPALALSTDNLEEKTENELGQIVRQRTVHALGGALAFYNKAYLPSEAALKESFNGYLRLADPHFEAAQKIPEEQAKAYRQYRNGLGKYSPYTLPKSLYKRVRSNVRKNGVYVDSYWDPRDKAGFYAAVEKKIRNRIDPQYNHQMFQHFGFHLPSDLNFQGFIQHKKMQGYWHSKMSTPKHLTLATGWSFEEFKARMFDPWMDYVVENEVERLLSPIETFEDGGTNVTLGNDAIRAAYIPLVAFIFSTIGALVHTFKTAAFALLMGMYRWKPIAYAVAGCAAAVLTYVWVIPAATTSNSVSESLLFTKLEEDTIEKAGPGMAMVMRGLIQVQTEFYPISEAIRTKVLFGIRYEKDWELKDLEDWISNFLS